MWTRNSNTRIPVKLRTLHYKAYSMNPLSNDNNVWKLKLKKLNKGLGMEYMKKKSV